jgi:RNA polymerase sigma-70 factor (ECF subfamily)
LAWQADERLLDEIRAGRQEACAAFVRQHYAAIYRFLLHLTGNAAQAEDLTQDTFATAWEKMAAFEGRSSFQTWLHRIAFCKFADARRSLMRRSILVERLMRETPPINTSGPLETAIANDQARRLHATIGQLEDLDRSLIVLHYLQDLSYREVSTVVEQPVGTVKWRIKMALDRLRQLLAEPEKYHDPQRTAAE